MVSMRHAVKKCSCVLLVMLTACSTPPTYQKQKLVEALWQIVQQPDSITETLLSKSLGVDLSKYESEVKDVGIGRAHVYHVKYDARIQSVEWATFPSFPPFRASESVEVEFGQNTCVTEQEVQTAINIKPDDEYMIIHVNYGDGKAGSLRNEKSGYQFNGYPKGSLHVRLRCSKTVKIVRLTAN